MPHPENHDDVEVASWHARAPRHSVGQPLDSSPSGGTRSSLSGSPADLAALDPVLVDLVEEATKRILGGETIDIEKIVEEHPAWAEMLRSLLPAMRSLAELAEGGGEDFPEAGRDEEGRTVFGNFRILREVGRGGMGVVYEAEQVALKRRVALKILPQASAMDPRALQRFQLEAQVAGWLQHPRIVPVHDVGLVHGVPYYAMQFIEGGSLADLVGELRHLVDGHSEVAASHSSSEGLSTVAAGLLSGRLAPLRREPEGSRHGSQPARGSDHSDASGGPSLRSRAFLRAVAGLGVQAAEALGYAHDQGVVHRDIKPANLLVDLRGELWVADFGMADVQGDAGLTVTGDLPGTLRYMSPEQALGKRALVDRRTDIYSLGATLYELLTLRPAITGDDRQEIFRRIAEEEPTPLRRLNPAVPFDLATIIAKAMAKDPSNRYETAWHLAEDLGRFLDGRPIVARPVGPLARSWRWCRRKPIQAGLVAALGLAIVVGFAGITWNWREAVRQKRLMLVAEQEARGEAAKAAAINRFLIEGLLDRAEPASNPAANRLTLSEALDRAAAKVGSSFAGQSEIEATIQLAVGRAYHGLGEYFKSESHYRAAHKLFERLGDRDRADRLEAASGLGHLLSHLGRWDEARTLLTRSLAEARRTLGHSHATSLRTAEYLAEVHRTQGRLQEAESLYRSSLGAARLASKPDPDIMFSARFNLGDVFLQEGRFDEAETLYRGLVDEQRRSKGPEHPSTLTTLNNLGVSFEKQKKYAEAEQIFRESLATDRKILGARHPDTVTALYNLGHVLNQQGRFEEAEPLFRQSLEARRQSLGTEHPSTLYVASSLAALLRTRGRLDEAETLLRRCLDAQRRVLGPEHRHTLLSAARLDDLLKDRSHHTHPDSTQPTGVADP
ncbi:Tetratricopeptide repeat-containing protein [Singulisphaera sp. GP187]|uniref:serine/threonine-protein kinase n=1 Tax=Singulisphaera sp. GP187 TaxID=1882752 RepID=UPI000929EDB4|nr:serine/threonine-protein kinase [Singulisphaera sp. GP187]SIO58871.1 Tetratricopeptide repeat-containing protein [Singulisphaera sp. GP187]